MEKNFVNYEETKLEKKYTELEKKYDELNKHHNQILEKYNEILKKNLELEDKLNLGNININTNTNTNTNIIDNMNYDDTYDYILKKQYSQNKNAY
jgi:hypothetical protein